MHRLGLPGSFAREPNEAVLLERTALINVKRGRKLTQRVGIGRGILTTRRLVLDFRRWNYLYWLAAPLLFRPLVGTFEVPLLDVDTDVTAQATCVRLMNADEQISLDFKLGRQLFQEGLSEEWASGIRQIQGEPEG